MRRWKNPRDSICSRKKAEQSDAPKSRIGRFLIASFLAATSVIAVVRMKVCVAMMDDNPYASKGEVITLQQSSAAVGLVIGAIGLLVSLCPSLLLLRAMRSLYYELVSMPEIPESIRPMGLAVEMFMLMGIGLTIATPIALLCSWQAKKCNSRIGASMSILGAMLFWLPWPILVYGLDWICVQTGTTLGS